MQKIRTIDELFYKELGKQYRSVREHRDITQKEVSQETGLSRPLVVNYEYGYSKIKPKNWIKLCKALGISDKIKITVEIGED